MAVDEEIIRFEYDDRAAVVAALDELSAQGDGEGWINIRPALTEEQEISVPVRSGLAAWFSGRGEPVAMATWTPAASGGRPRPAQIGVAHGTGPNALPRLAEQGLPLPAGWKKRQDHAKHGIVADLPSDADHDAVVRWLLAAVSELMSVVSAGDRWTAVVHRPG